MVEDGVLEQYAIGGAVAAIFYVEPINTNDLDIFFSATSIGSNLAVLAPLYRYLSDLGYSVQGETIDIEGWPVQFLPVFNPLVEEALEQAKETEFERTTTRVITSEHLVAIMLQTGRLKDYARIQQFLEHKVVNRRRLNSILRRHDLVKKWSAFENDYLR
ncbi:MAG: hypothetical protein ACREBG_06575 [Pyrinomonadaceae bacterium]